MTLAPTAGIEVVGYSPMEVHELGLSTAEPTTGLSVVGEGELVFLKATLDEEASGYAWTLTGPDSSSATLDSTDTEIVSFRPDVVGTYTVQVTATGSTGSATATQQITAAHYVGAGTFGVTAQASKGHCAACHTGQAAKWMATGHATMFSEAIDGLKSSHYNEACIECHTVGFNENAAAENGGFDDVAEQVGWTFPETLQEGNWEEILTNYPELANLANIQCENCHGPGGQHFGRKDGIAISLEEDVCGRCHEEEPYHVYPLQWETSAHATGTSFARGSSGSCAPCHSGEGFIAKVDPMSDLAAKTGNTSVTCAVCHDPHPEADGAVHQLRTIDTITLNNGLVVDEGGRGQLCMNCHMSRRDADEYVEEYHGHYGPHHSNQADMLVGTNAVEFGRTLPISTHYQAVENTCVGCHMSETPGSGEAGHNELGEHSWAMSTMVDGEEVDNVAACVRCHGELESFEDIKARKDYDEDGTIEAATAEIHGLLEEVAMLLPPVGEPTVEVTPDYTKIQLKAAYNYFFVEDDQSEGIHNFQYAVALLELARDAMTFGVLSPGQITGIVDVPNDQGKQVRVNWTRFGGDGTSDRPIEMYYVWRRDDTGAAASKNVQVFESLADVPVDADLGDAVLKINEQVWTKVGNQPASELELYSAVVPTLYDSTAADGAQWSVFTVSGHTDVSTINVWADADSTYSVDNLEPSVPGGVAATVQGNRVTLKWDELPDADVDYVAVYRSTAPGFNPAGRQPVATLAGTTEYVDTGVMAGQTYYYRLASFDFSGNQSGFSPEITAGVATGVESLAGIPTEFELRQNYPNPFNPSTQISFGVPEATRVRIVVYDVSGRAVGTVVDRQMAPGRYQVQWQADHLASGVYIYRMETSGFVSTKTMMLLK